MRLFYAALALETNTFLPIPTSYQAFVEKIYYPPGNTPRSQATRPARSRRRVQQRNAMASS